MKWHPSSIGNLMASPRNKTEALSEGAKTYIREIAKQNFYGYKSEIRTKPVMKGIDQELESIALLNAVRFTDYKKNNLRVESEYLSGECDIITEDSIIDCKTSWSLETFPAFVPKRITQNMNGKALHICCYMISHYLSLFIA